jgi:hypothetical protein
VRVKRKSEDCRSLSQFTLSLSKERAEFGITTSLRLGGFARTLYRTLIYMIFRIQIGQRGFNPCSSAGSVCSVCCFRSYPGDSARLRIGLQRNPLFNPFRGCWCHGGALTPGFMTGHSDFLMRHFSNRSYHPGLPLLNHFVVIGKIMLCQPAAEDWRFLIYFWLTKTAYDPSTSHTNQCSRWRKTAGRQTCCARGSMGCSWLKGIWYSQQTVP